MITKEAVGEHALNSACILHWNEHIVDAHILAGAAAEVLRHVAEEASGFSILQAF